MSGLARAARAFPTLLRVGLAEALAYRAELVVWMLTTTMPLVSLALWTSVADSGALGEYGARELGAYFLAALVVRQVTGSWLVWQMNMEVKQGGMSHRLLRPVHPLFAYAAEGLAVIPLRAVLCLPIVPILLHYSGTEPLGDAARAGLFMASMLGAWLINFFVMALIGALSFFIESSTNVFQAWLLGFTVLSGYVVPLSLFPAWLRRLTDVLPFRYTLALPAELAAGTLSTERALVEVGIQWGYVALSAVLALVLFQRGTRRYAAFGA